MDAMTANNQEFVILSLAALARVSAERARKIISTQSAKGIVALVWRSGLSMQVAVAVQTKLAKIPPGDVLKPRAGSQTFPLTVEEMDWQLEFFAAMVGDVVG
jgi:hypothetical protein